MERLKLKYKVKTEYKNKSISFSEMFFTIAKDKNMTIAEVYNRANIDRRIITKIKNIKYRPKRNTAIALCIGLRLTVIEANKLLMTAGYILTDSLLEDCIVMDYINRDIYDISEINISLFEAGLKILGSVPRD